MTVASTTNRKTFAGDNVTTSFGTSPVIFFDTADLMIFVVNTTTGAATTLTENTDYTVTGGAGSTGTVSLAGGSAPWGALITGTTLVILRDLSLVQSADFVQNDGSDAQVVEDAFDKLTMMAQQLDARIDRSFILSDSDVSGASTVIPTPVASTVVGWNDTATALQNYSATDLDLALTTPFSLTLLDDATAAQARTTLGVAIGTNVQAFDSDLSAIAALSHTAGYAIRSNGSAWVADAGQSPNLLVNPNWQLDQINEGALYTVNTTGVNGPDGWSGSAVGAGVYKLRTLADPDNAALKCLEITCTTADASIAATDDYFIFSAVEGFDAAALQAGTSTAQQATLTFKFKSNVTGVYGVSLANSAKNRSNYQIITVADTNEHEYSLTFTLDTTGTWLYTNGVGLYLAICLAAGSNFQGTAGAWAADAKQTTSAQANFMSANTNVAYLKRIQLTQTALVQPYRPSDMNRELEKAQRYYSKSYSQGTIAGTSTAIGARHFAASGTGNQNAGTQYFPRTMRTTPTAVAYSTTGAVENIRNLSGATDLAVTSYTTGDAGTLVLPAGYTDQNIYAFQWTANARLS